MDLKYVHHQQSHWLLDRKRSSYDNLNRLITKQCLQWQHHYIITIEIISNKLGSISIVYILCWIGSTVYTLLSQQWLQSPSRQKWKLKDVLFSQGSFTKYVLSKIPWFKYTQIRILIYLFDINYIGFLLFDDGEYKHGNIS